MNDVLSGYIEIDGEDEIRTENIGGRRDKEECIGPSILTVLTKPLGSP